MFKKILFFLLFFSIKNYACTVIDDQGASVHLDRPANRIISLAPDLTEILFAIGNGDHLVGVIQGSDYPPAAKNIPRVGSNTGIDLERIIALKPDLIVAWNYSFSRQAYHFNQFHIPIYFSQAKQLADVPRTIKNLGCLTGSEKIADQVAKKFIADLNNIRKQHANDKKVTVFYQLGARSFFTINHDSWINQAISLCGGENIFANLKFISAEVGLESIITANPQVILNDAGTDNWKRDWQKWSEVNAVKNQFLYTVNPELIDEAGPRLIAGIQQICAYLDLSRQLRKVKSI